MNHVTLSIGAGCMFLTSCATQTTLAPLHQAQLACSIEHNPNACNAVPILQHNADEEANHNALLTAGLILLAPIAILAIGAASEPDREVIVVHNHRGW